MLNSLIRSDNPRNATGNYSFSDRRWWKGAILGY